VGLTALLAQTLGSFGLGDGPTYRARFTDVTGLLEGDDVRIAGVRVGEVTGIKVVENTVAEVSFTVSDDIPLDSGVLAKIRYRNLVGQRYLALFEGPGTGHRLREHDPSVPPLEPGIPAGSCLLWDFRLFHSGTANRSRRRRPMLYSTYARRWYQDPVNFTKSSLPRLVFEHDFVAGLSADARRLFPPVD